MLGFCSGRCDRRESVSRGLGAELSAADAKTPKALVSLGELFRGHMTGSQRQEMASGRMRNRFRVRSEGEVEGCA